MKFSKQKSDEIHNDITESISRETTEEASRVIIEDDYKKSRRHSKKKKKCGIHSKPTIHVLEMLKCEGFPW